MNALEINDLFEQESPVGQLYVRLKELGIQVERGWLISQKGVTYVVDLALPVGEDWLTVILVERLGPDGGLRFRTEVEADYLSANDPETKLSLPLKPGFGV
jgi:hypothetical protein